MHVKNAFIGPKILSISKAVVFNLGWIPCWEELKAARLPDIVGYAAKYIKISISIFSFLTRGLFRLAEAITLLFYLAKTQKLFLVVVVVTNRNYSFHHSQLFQRSTRYHLSLLYPYNHSRFIETNQLCYLQGLIDKGLLIVPKRKNNLINSWQPECPR